MVMLIEVSLINTSKGEGWELHRADCADVAKTVRRHQAGTRILASQTVVEALDEIIDEELREMGYTADEYVRVFPCCTREGGAG